MIIDNQVAINTTETVNSKLIFDREDQSQGELIKGYHNDNWVFNASDILEETLKNQKRLGSVILVICINMGHHIAPSRQWLLCQGPFLCMICRDIPRVHCTMIFFQWR